MGAATPLRLLGWSLLLVGLLTLGLDWVGGAITHSFVVHVVYPAAFWLAADGLLALQGQRPLLLRPALWLRMILVGAGLGLVLDFHLVHLTHILVLTAITTPAWALSMYLGWGLSMPAVYSSFRAARLWLGPPWRPAVSPSALVPWLGMAGLPLAELALFFHLWVGWVPGWFVVPVFSGIFLLAEYVLGRRGRPSLLGSWLSLDPRPLLAMILASIPFTVLWEGLDVVTGSWHYRGIFLLEPRLAGVPLVAYFGYLTGYYGLFLAVWNAITPQPEGVLPLYSQGNPLPAVAVQDGLERMAATAQRGRLHVRGAAPDHGHPDRRDVRRNVEEDG